MVATVYYNEEWLILDNLTNLLVRDTDKTDYARTTRVSVAIIRRSGCSTKGASDTSNIVPPRGRDIAAAVSDDAARLRLTLRSLRRQRVCQLGPQLFDHLVHLVRDNADVFNIEHVFMKAL